MGASIYTIHVWCNYPICLLFIYMFIYYYDDAKI